MQVTQGSHTSEAWSLRSRSRGRHTPAGKLALPVRVSALGPTGQVTESPLIDGCLELRFLLPPAASPSRAR